MNLAKPFKYAFFSACLYLGIMMSVALVDQSHGHIEVVDGDDVYWLCDKTRTEWSYEERTGLFIHKVTDDSKKYFK